MRIIIQFFFSSYKPTNIEPLLFFSSHLSIMVVSHSHSAQLFPYSIFYPYSNSRRSRRRRVI